MGKAILDLKGRKFDRLTVLELLPERNSRGHAVWKCECSCGNIINVVSYSLTSKNTKSCGCIRRETTSESALAVKELYNIENTNI